jgi:hypothetical protein
MAPSASEVFRTPAPLTNIDTGTRGKRFRRCGDGNITLLDTVSATDLSKRLTHPERGEMTFEVIIETMAGHDLNHLGQIEKIVSQH